MLYWYLEWTTEGEIALRTIKFISWIKLKQTNKNQENEHRLQENFSIIFVSLHRLWRKYNYKLMVKC